MHEPRLPSRCHPTGRFPVRAMAWMAVPLLTLAACGNADSSLGRSFGQGGAAADEVRVTSRPPLSLPPEFTLRPDRPGVIRPIAAAPAATPARPTSAGQEALLDASGPAATPDIRTRVNEDARMEAPAQGFTDQLMTWQRPPEQPAIIQRGPSSGGLLGRLF